MSGEFLLLCYLHILVFWSITPKTDITVQCYVCCPVLNVLHSDAMQCSTVQCSAVMSSAFEYNSVAVHFSKVECSTFEYICVQ